MYPRRSHLLIHLADRLSLFLDCKQRLIRLTFLQIGIHIFKVILEQRALVANMIERLNITSQGTLTNSKTETMVGCLKLIDKSLSLVAGKMFVDRIHDP